MGDVEPTLPILDIVGVSPIQDAPTPAESAEVSTEIPLPRGAEELGEISLEQSVLLERVADFFCSHHGIY